MTPQRPPLFFLLFFALFGCIGVAVLIFLWGHDDGFGDPPLIFKVFGSFIALAFILMGFGAPISGLRKWKEMSKHGQPGGESPVTPRPPGSYDCPNCGANVKNAEVSPSGDVKCTYCNEWWNVHR